METIKKEMVDFINEATQVHNETGLTPRQLLEQRDELLAALKEMMGVYTFGGSGGVENRNRACEMARKAIQKTNPAV